MKKFILIFSILASSISVLAEPVHCSNFNTQAEAQAYMERNRAYHLDRDRDGEACECLPGGSKYGSSRCAKR